MKTFRSDIRVGAKFHKFKVTAIEGTRVYLEDKEGNCFACSYKAVRALCRRYSRVSKI